MKTEIVAVRYKSGAFVPLSPRAVADKFQEGELYFFRPDRKRYWPEHQAFMALMNEAFETLPDDLQKEYLTPDILRRRLLVASGFATIDSMVCQSADDALRTAVKIGRHLDDHTFLSIRGDVLVIARAHSQRMSAMDKETFRKSCQAVIVELEKLLGCSAGEIKAHAASLEQEKP